MNKDELIKELKDEVRVRTFSKGERYYRVYTPVSEDYAKKNPNQVFIHEGEYLREFVFVPVEEFIYGNDLGEDEFFYIAKGKISDLYIDALSLHTDGRTRRSYLPVEEDKDE